MRSTFAMLLLGGYLAAPAAAQQSPLAAARDLYASARYDEALLVLNGLRPRENGPAELKAIEQYRSLCLLALGRAGEAEAAIAAVVAADPMYLPSESEASPRVRSAFSEVRQRQLPEIARARYLTAKASYDRKDFASAERQFADLLTLIDDPDMSGRLGDMRVLVSGFLDLAVAANTPPPPPKKEEPAPASPAPLHSAGHIFSAEDAEVVPPVPNRQEVPSVPTAIKAQIRDKGLLEVIIDEQGRVIGLDMRVRLHPIFDSQLLAAAKDWRYRPAMLRGKPVRYRKLVQISVAK